MHPDKIERKFAELLLKAEISLASSLLNRAERDNVFTEARLLNLKGLLARSAMNLEEAENLFLDSIRFDPAFVPPLSNLSSLYLSQGRFKEALTYARLAYKRSDSETLAVAMPLVTALLDSANIAEAMSVLDDLPPSKLKQRDPQLALSACLRQSGRYDEARVVIDDLVRDYQNDPTVLRVKADLEGELGFVDPLPIYERALASAISAGKTNLSALKWNMSLHLLRARQFGRGWEYYEEGLSSTVGTLGRPLPEPFRRMKRVDFDKIDRSKWTIVVVEQGIGDQVLFLSAMSEALQNIPKLAFICEERLKPIIKRSFPGLILLSAGVIEFLPHTGLPINGYIPLGSLFGKYRPSIDSFIKNRKPFLQVNRVKYDKFRTTLRKQAAGRPIVGLSWKGGFWENQQRNKAVDLSAWESILNLSVLPVNLQYGNISSDLEWATSKGYEIVMFPDLDFKVDIDDWMAIAAACDGIISVSTAIVHFAGACNQKVAVVMPERKGPWILGLDDTRSITYPNVHYFRKAPTESVEQLLIRVSRIVQ
jgi:tetratricopeptide (TPR) repeat protein